MRTLIGAALAAAGLTLVPMSAASAAEIGPSTQGAASSATVSDVLKAYPGSRQVAPDKVAADGFSVTVQTSGHLSSAAVERMGAAPRCDYGHLCLFVNGLTYDFYECETTRVLGWYGASYFINNQTPGTVASFYNEDYSLRWTSTAYEEGTFDATPIGSVKPC
ncbi:hypothetical protein [Luteipulveratus mongoliensis]|uniref:hypothetical protein n=1 Tax=Luteipulveratus mongoliensis TaxID=571913 RepID=UPI0006978C32|nr:hypothetical protein [Luteipulveratus mongoliensis]